MTAGRTGSASVEREDNGNMEYLGSGTQSKRLISPQGSFVHEYIMVFDEKNSAAWAGVMDLRACLSVGCIGIYCY